MEGVCVGGVALLPLLPLSLLSLLPLLLLHVHCPGGTPSAPSVVDLCMSLHRRALPAAMRFHRGSSAASPGGIPPSARHSRHSAGGAASGGSSSSRSSSGSGGRRRCSSRKGRRAIAYCETADAGGARHGSGWWGAGGPVMDQAIGATDPVTAICSMVAAPMTP